MMYPGMKGRIEKELLEMRPFQSAFKVLLVHITSCCVKSIKYLFSDYRSHKYSIEEGNYFLFQHPEIATVNISGAFLLVFDTC